MNDEHRLSDQPWEGVDQVEKFLGDLPPQGIKDPASQEQADIICRRQSVKDTDWRYKVMEDALELEQSALNQMWNVNWICHKIRVASEANDKWPWTASRVSVATVGKQTIRATIRASVADKLDDTTTRMSTLVQHYQITSIESFFWVMTHLLKKAENGEWIVTINCTFELCEMIRMLIMRPPQSVTKSPLKDERQGVEDENR